MKKDKKINKKEALKAAFAEIKSLSDPQFSEEMLKHQNSKLANIILSAGTFEGQLQEFKQRFTCQYSTPPPYRLQEPAE